MKKVFNLRAFVLMLIVGMVGLVGYTLNDLGTAQGIGLYLAMQCGSENRLPFDIGVDAVGVILFLAVLIIPCVLLKHRTVDSLFRITATYLAFMPAISMGILVHLFDGHDLWPVKFDWQIGLNYLCDFAQVIIPIVFVLGYFYKDSGFRMKGWHKILLIAIPVLFVGVISLPELSPVLLQVIYYLGLLVSFDWWESIYIKAEKYEKTVLWIVFGLFCCRGCLRMFELINAYHL